MHRLIPALLCSAALLPAAAGQAPGPSPSGPAAATASPAPLPSEELRALRDDLAEIVRGTGWRDASYGVLVVSLDRGDTLFALNPDLALAPASNLKLYSTAAALYYLGPEFRYSTYLLGDGEVSAGVLEGDLILYGTGDPSISGRLLESGGSVLAAFADSLAALGIREVRGDVVGDGSYFDDAWIGEGWEDDDRMAWYGAPVGALSFGENMVSVRVGPGSSAGEPARIRTSPATEGLALTNRVRTVSRGGTRVRFEHGPEGIVVEGQIARGHPGIARSLPVVDPGNYAAAAFRAVLEERGIRVDGDVRGVRDPAASAVAMAAGSPADGSPPRVLAAHLSPPLAELVRVTNHISHNLFADALLKTVGRVALGEGSFEAGARAVQYFLECETEADPAALRVIDGSGLSKLNRVTARATIQLLDYMTRAGEWDSYHASLPEAASPDDLRHSLRHRMGQTAAQGNLRAKTGTIQRVSSLSGYVRSAGGERLAFSIIGNEVPSTWRAKRLEDAIGARLAGFRRPEPAGAPVASDPAPAPEEPPVARPDTGAATGGEQETAAAEPAPPRTHRVRRGETLDAIARRYGTTVQALQRANPDLRPRRLQIGQEIEIPR